MKGKQEVCRAPQAIFFRNLSFQEENQGSRIWIRAVIFQSGQFRVYRQNQGNQGKISLSRANQGALIDQGRLVTQTPSVLFSETHRSPQLKKSTASSGSFRFNLTAWQNVAAHVLVSLRSLHILPLLTATKMAAGFSTSMARGVLDNGP